MKSKYFTRTGVIIEEMLDAESKSDVSQIYLLNNAYVVTLSQEICRVAKQINTEIFPYVAKELIQLTQKKNNICGRNKKGLIELLKKEVEKMGKNLRHCVGSTIF